MAYQAAWRALSWHQHRAWLLALLPRPRTQQTPHRNITSIAARAFIVTPPHAARIAASAWRRQTAGDVSGARARLP
jgi:hypothetical protein